MNCVIQKTVLKLSCLFAGIINVHYEFICFIYAYNMNYKMCHKNTLCPSVCIRFYGKSLTIDYDITYMHYEKVNSKNIHENVSLYGSRTKV